MPFALDVSLTNILNIVDRVAPVALVASVVSKNTSCSSCTSCIATGALPSALFLTPTVHTNRQELELERLLLAPVAARANLENDSPHDKKYAFYGDEK